MFTAKTRAFQDLLTAVKEVCQTPIVNLQNRQDAAKGWKRIARHDRDAVDYMTLPIVG